MNRQALIVAFDNSDKNFFKAHPDRRTHIRLPFRDECAGQFWSLGDHNRTQRRILLALADSGEILKIPMLAFPQENLEDTDEALLPIVGEIMQGATR